MHIVAVNYSYPEIRSLVQEHLFGIAVQPCQVVTNLLDFGILVQKHCVEKKGSQNTVALKRSFTTNL